MSESLKHKIKKLFSYRELYLLPKFSNTQESIIAQNCFFDKLEFIQKTIYYLDQELESNYEIDQNTLDERWAEIYKALDALGLSNHDHYCSDIYRYQKHELSIRENDAILKLPMEFFYYYKSCDVKLIRRIIYERYPDLELIMPIEKWKFFDLVTEVNDDIEDVFEDLGTINGNRYMLEFQRFGLEVVNKKFKYFLDKSYAKFCEPELKILHPLIREKSEMVYRNTIALLKDRYEQITNNGLTKVGAKL